MFYDRFVELCKQKGVAPSRAAVDAGISKSLVSKWKSNAAKEPSPDIVRKLAAYFEVSPFEILEDREAVQPGERRISDDELKFALWGDCEDIDEDDLADVRSYAAFVRERKKRK